MSRQATIVIPVFNEFLSLQKNLEPWIQFCEKRDWRLIIVDDGSTDDSVQLLRSLIGHPILEVYHHRSNMGYGYALKTGLDHVETEYSITMDADGQHQIEDTEILIGIMHDEDFDMVIGSRQKIKENNLYRKLGKSIIRAITRLLFSTSIYDLNSGFKAYKTEIVKQLLPFCPDSMAFSDIITLLHLEVGLKINEQPIQLNPRSSGKSSINTMTAFQTLMEIFNIVMWFHPSKILLPLAFILTLLGFIWAIPFFIRGRGLSSTALLFLLAGSIQFMLALLAEQIAWTRKKDLPRIGITKLNSTSKD